MYGVLFADVWTECTQICGNSTSTFQCYLFVLTSVTSIGEIAWKALPPKKKKKKKGDYPAEEDSFQQTTKTEMLVKEHRIR